MRNISYVESKQLKRGIDTLKLVFKRHVGYSVMGLREAFNVALVLRHDLENWVCEIDSVLVLFKIVSSR